MLQKTIDPERGTQMSTDLLGIDTAIEDSIPSQEVDTEVDDALENEEETDDNAKDDEGDDEGDEKQDSEKAGDDESDSETDENEPDKKETRYQKRTSQLQQNINDLTKQRYQLERENEEYRRASEDRKPDLPPQPDPNSYSYKTEEERVAAQRQYDYDMGQWNSKVESINEQHSKRDEVRIQKEQQHYFAKMEKEPSVFGKYNDAVKSLENLKMTPELHSALQHEDNSADLFCFLGSNPGIAKTVLSMPGYQQARELAKISLKLSSAVDRQKNKKSKAPKPAAKTPKGKGPAPKKDPGKMSAEEWAKSQGYMT